MSDVEWVRGREKFRVRWEAASARERETMIDLVVLVRL